jgi:hypothetical protein
MIRMVPAGWALAQRGPHSPVVFKVAKGWRDRAYRRACRRGVAVAAIAPAEASAALAPGAGLRVTDTAAAPELVPAASRQTDYGDIEYAGVIAGGEPREEAAAYPWSGGAS